MYAKKIKVIIADDHYFFREGLKHALEEASDIEIIGEAGDGKRLIDAVNEKHPDIVLTDVEMPVVDGLKAVKSIIASRPLTGIIGLSTFGKHEYIIDMMEAGALGYLLKDTELHQLKNAIYAAYNGEIFFGSSLNKRLLRKLSQSNLPLLTGPTAISLTTTEINIIVLICEGLTNKEIAGKLRYTTRTVETYRKKIMEKLEIRSPAVLAIYAVRNGIYNIDKGFG